jgi:hypothetical protein
VRSERLRLLSEGLAPEVREHIRVGAGDRVDAWSLGEFMADWREPRVPGVAPVFYNGLAPVVDPDLAREGVHVGGKGRGLVSLGAKPR